MSNRYDIDKDLKVREDELTTQLHNLGQNTQVRIIKELISVRYARRKEQLVAARSEEIGGRASELREILLKVLNFPE